MGGKGDYLADFIRKHDIKIFLEMGVYKGKMINYLMSQVEDVLEEYWAVDKWEVCQDYIDRRTPIYEDGWKKIKWWAYHSAMKWPKTVHVINMHSEDAATLFKDEYFDFIFIDGEHTYDPMVGYIESWYPKAKEGSFFGGHDINYEGVRKAVAERFGDENIVVLDYNCWYVIA